MSVAVLLWSLLICSIVSSMCLSPPQILGTLSTNTSINKTSSNSLIIIASPTNGSTVTAPAWTIGGAQTSPNFQLSVQGGEDVQCDQDYGTPVWTSCRDAFLDVPDAFEVQRFDTWRPAADGDVPLPFRFISR